MLKLGVDFYLREDILTLSRELLGKTLCTQFNGKLTTGIIVEAEAYAGVTDKASHAFDGKRTSRTEVMYAEGGTAYVYLCYGMHHLFNIVTNVAGIPHAILIRGIEPVDGLETMLRRRKMKKPAPKLTAGPACLTQALGITVEHSGMSLLKNKIWVEDRNYPSDRSKQSKGYKFEIVTGPRVGCQYAGKDALNPWRFSI